MNSSAYKELQLLNEIATESSVTQRSLANKLQMALGLTNLMIRRCVKKGHVKVVNIQRNRIRYLLTPQGIAEKTRLTYEYLQYSLYLYRRVRQLLRERLAQVVQAGGRDILIYGTGEVAEMAYLSIEESGLHLVGVIDDRAVGRPFVGMTVVGTPAVRQLTFDYVIVSTLDTGPNGFQALQALGVAEHQILKIEPQAAEAAGPVTLHSPGARPVVAAAEEP